MTETERTVAVRNMTLQTMLITTVLQCLREGMPPRNAWREALRRQRDSGVDPRALLQDILVIQFLGDMAPGKRPWQDQISEEAIASDREFVVARSIEILDMAINTCLCDPCKAKVQAFVEAEMKR